MPRNESTSYSRWFWFQYLIYSIVIVVSTLWAYGRLDFDRSYDTSEESAKNEQPQA